MREAHDLAQGRKGTGDDKKSVGFRCPADIYAWLLEGRLPRDTDTDRVLRILEQQKDFEAGMGDRLRELVATSVLEGVTLGHLAARLALEGLDSKKKHKR